MKKLILCSLMLIGFYSLADNTTPVNIQPDLTTPTLEVSATQKVAELVNKERKKRGIAPLKGDVSLSLVAGSHARDMYAQNYFSHKSLDGRTMGDRLHEGNVLYRAAGENIAWGQKTAEKVMAAWMKSPGHRKNILNPKYHKIGIARAGHYWVQNFTD